MRPSSSALARRASRKLLRLHRDEGGFTLVEAMAALTVLAIGIFGAAQAITIGLSTTGLSRQRLAARAGLDQQMEEARALNYDNLVLSDPDPGLTHSTDPMNPDYWVDTADQTFDPDGDGPLPPESLVRVPGASPALQHFQNPFIVGSTTYSVYRYVTWIDLSGPGTDPDGHDEKRVTVVVTWTDEFGRTPVNQVQSSIFTDGRIEYKAPAINEPPTVSCPTAVQGADGLTFDFTAIASDSDGTIASVSWTFKDGSTVLGTASGPTASYPFTQYSHTYSVQNSVVDNAGGTATNTGLNCTVTTGADPLPGNDWPDAQMKIANDATYTNTTIVTLNISSGPGQHPDKMRFSNDGTTWSPWVAYSTTVSWTLLPGGEGKDGNRTVYARLYNDAETSYSARLSDAIVLDTTPPGTPANLHVSASSTLGANTDLTLAWTAPSDVTGLGGYRLYRRVITSTGSFSLVCDTSGTSCNDAHKSSDSYEYYVIAYDLAGNQSAQSNHITA